MKLLPNKSLKYFEKFGNVFLEFSVRCQVLICNSGGVLMGIMVLCIYFLRVDISDLPPRPSHLTSYLQQIFMTCVPIRPMSNHITEYRSIYWDRKKGKGQHWSVLFLFFFPSSGFDNRLLIRRKSNWIVVFQLRFILTTTSSIHKLSL